MSAHRGDGSGVLLYPFAVEPTMVTPTAARSDAVTAIGI